MKPLYAAVITAICTVIPVAMWIYTLYALANLAILKPEIQLLGTLATCAILGGSGISFIPGFVWDLLADPDPFETLEDGEEK
jgi:hypothetical protein